MSVLYSELLVPGWAQTGEKVGLNDVTGTYDDPRAYSLPCHTAAPETFFSEAPADIKAAKALCGECPVRSKCLSGALSRSEPCGVWGGELFDGGIVIDRKRKVGRPRVAA
ncbi:unannotated protein [freshwater metagenome]|uniref:Unannotated protein n=1 Tax=freshwater metagenome TaxID=449393 RepID=A0A6J7XU81_9ZZZZ|nr:transcriptional regulator [Actinomycetota bacterium]